MKKTLLFLFALFAISFHSYSQWSAVSNGFNNDVNATCVYDNAFYAAGNFTFDGSVTTALSHIARWNGTSWVPVGTGLDANVKCMVVFNSELYVGGDFANAGGSPASNIAKWNGTTWSSIGAGFNSTVRCLYVRNNELYAGGTFTMSGTASIARIAKLSGSTWQVVGGGAVGPVNAIIDYNGELIIGGNWYPPYVSRFNASTLTFDDLNGLGGPDNEVTSLAVFRKQTVSNIVLWIGGKFNTPSPRLCTWTSSGGFTTSFNNFNSTAGGNVNVLLATSNYLFAGGGFTATVSSNNISKLARYDGVTFWDSVGVTPNSDVNSLTPFNNSLVAGGKFTSLGSAGTANRVAWRDFSLVVDELNKEILSIDFYPNPLVTSSILKLQTTSALLQTELKIFDSQGKEMSAVAENISFNPLNHEVEYCIERKGLPAGIYFYELSEQRKNIAAGKFVVE